MLDMKPEGAAVTSWFRMEGVGSWEARLWARGPRERRRAGSVGKAFMPATEALEEKG